MSVDPYAPPLHTDQFLSFYTELKQIMDASGHLYINIYSDPDGNSPALDNAGNAILHRWVKYVVYTYASSEVSTSASDKGGIKIVFFDNDNTYIEFPNSEPVILYWYSIDGITPIVIKAFT